MLFWGICAQFQCTSTVLKSQAHVISRMIDVTLRGVLFSDWRKTSSRLFGLLPRRGSKDPGTQARDRHGNMVSCVSSSLLSLPLTQLASQPSEISLCCHTLQMVSWLHRDLSVASRLARS